MRGNSHVGWCDVAKAMYRGIKPGDAIVCTCRKYVERQEGALEKLKTLFAALSASPDLMGAFTAAYKWPFTIDPTDRGEVIGIKPLPSLMDDPQIRGAWMTHPPSPTAVPPPPMTEKQVDEMIAYVVQAWPKGALAKLYRILYADGMRIDSAKLEETKWLKSLKK